MNIFRKHFLDIFTVVLLSFTFIYHTVTRPSLWMTLALLLALFTLHSILLSAAVLVGSPWRAPSFPPVRRHSLYYIISPLFYPLTTPIPTRELSTFSTYHPSVPPSPSLPTRLPDAIVAVPPFLHVYMASLTTVDVCAFWQMRRWHIVEFDRGL